MPEKKNNPHIGLWTPAVYAAAHVARRLHLGQYDKGGNDYFTSHLLKVGGAGETWKQQVIGFLHDAEEDTHHDVDTVLRMVKQLLQKWSEHPEDKSWMDIFKGHDIPPCSDDAIVFPTDDDWKEIADALPVEIPLRDEVRDRPLILGKRENLCARSISSDSAATSWLCRSR